MPGGVGTLEHLVEGVTKGHASAVLAASIFHFGEYTVRQVQKMEDILKDVPEVQAYGSVVAFALAGPGQANSAIVPRMPTGPAPSTNAVLP